jgi:hypothetical protein
MDQRIKFIQDECWPGTLRLVRYAEQKGTSDGDLAASLCLPAFAKAKPQSLKVWTSASNTCDLVK